MDFFCSEWSDMSALELKQIWDRTDRSLYLNPEMRLTNHGLGSIWLAIDKTIRFCSAVLNASEAKRAERFMNQHWFREPDPDAQDVELMDLDEDNTQNEYSYNQGYYPPANFYRGRRGRRPFGYRPHRRPWRY